MTLTESQREAVESWGRGDACVVAGPGSGKTRVLVERFRWLVEAQGVEPARILAITFTERAAANMYEQLMAPVQDAELRQKYERAQISTIDAFCMRLLREHALEAEVDPEFQIIDRWAADLELRRVIAAALNEAHSSDPEAARRFLNAFAASSEFVDDLQLSSVHKHVFHLHEAIRVRGGKTFLEHVDCEPDWAALTAAVQSLAEQRGLASLAAWAGSPQRAERPFGPRHLDLLGELQKEMEALNPAGLDPGAIGAIRELLPKCRASTALACHASSRAWLLEILRETERRFQEWKRQAGVLDFSDLEQKAVELLEKTPSLGGRFQHILIDELQDTNGIQAKLLRLLRGNPGDGRRALFGVGDINQAIYGFRHADPQVFRDFRAEVEGGEGHLVHLRQNFRSRPEILRAVETLLAGVEGIEPQRLVAGSLYPDKAIPSVEVLIARGADPEAAKRQEILMAASRMMDLRAALRVGSPGDPPRWKDFAVLVRTHNLASRFTAGLREAGIPCQLMAGRGFFDAPEVRDLIHLLRVLRNPRDEISLAAVLRSPLAGISDDSLLRLKIASRGNLADALHSAVPLPAEDEARFARFRTVLESHRALREDVAPETLLERLVAATGYEAYLLSRDNGPQQLANVRKLITFARLVAKPGQLRFHEWIERLDALRDASIEEPEAATAEESTDAVHVMTLHTAKGLEFPVVFIPSLQSPPRADSPVVGYDPDRGIGAKWVDPAGGEDLRDPALTEVQQHQKTREAEESARLFYVGMTRAREHLVLSAYFARSVRATNWAKYLRSNLRVDLKAMDDEPPCHEVKGNRLRVWRSDREPPIKPTLVLEKPASEMSWVDPARAVIEQSDSSAAVTSIVLHAQCPRRYYLSRHLGFGAPPILSTARSLDRDPAADEASPEADETDATELGRRVHGVLAGSLPAAEPGSLVMQLVRNFEESDLGRRAASAQAVHREQGLLFPVDGRLLQGQIDLWFDAADERILVDYKTDQVSASEAPGRALDYALQLQLYALALEAGTGRRPDQAVAYFLRPNVASPVTLSGDALEAARASVQTFFAAQSAIDFPLRVDTHCLRCPHYRRLCPAQLSPKESSAAARAEPGRAGPPEQLPLRFGGGLP